METFCGLTPEQTEDVFGYATYLERYGCIEGEGPDLTAVPDEFEDWQIVVPFVERSVILLCCPEDRRCATCDVQSGGPLCRDCELPMCRFCRSALSNEKGGRMPPMA